MRTLLIDNYDSFTYNLFQLLAEANGEDPVVVRNDEVGWPELAATGFDNIVISPGPGRPDRVVDFGVCAEAIRHSRAPLLGVCLGHQGLGWVNGAALAPAPEPRHGRLSRISHRGSPLFAGIPTEFEAVRYHSLCLEEPLPAELEPLAWSDDGVLMALVHRHRPQWGVQFHPESVCTEHGRRLLANFRDLTAARATPLRPRRPPDRARGEGEAELELSVRRLDLEVDPEVAFAAVYGDSDPAFWLDSSRAGEAARFSFMGDGAGPLGARVTYSVADREVRIEGRGGAELVAGTIFEYLAAEMRRLRLPASGLPFDFECGFVGYLGYELKADCGGERVHDSPLADAALVFADRLVVLDHLERRTYLLCLVEPGGGEGAATWTERTERLLRSLPPLASAEERPAPDGPGPAIHLRRGHRRYLEDIAVCKQRLHEGETYEVCLTNKIVIDAELDPLPLYLSLRRRNPSPFSAFLRLGAAAVLSSSPERFLRIDRDRRVEAKPIKGTTRRDPDPTEDARLAAELAASDKDRAENLMVTDLLRNDLGVVCEVGTVEVPKLMEVESHGAVHHLVSTVRGRLRAEVEPAECIRACFPGGSMTGAPKKRTMEIIDELEGEARGVYSGAIGYLGLGGACDLSIAIRTVVLEGRSATVGIGGAIVAQSDPEAEYQESLLKGLAPIQAVDPRADPRLL
ncbi:MAG: aminodeoxychorismate synthase component I [Solirubrobacterales bacterium]|nr:aminodeoxychorismate synthase component I [Solirubrobacterales bacterium]